MPSLEFWAPGAHTVHINSHRLIHIHIKTNKQTILENKTIAGCGGECLAVGGVSLGLRPACLQSSYRTSRATQKNLASKKTKPNQTPKSKNLLSP